MSEKTLFHTVLESEWRSSLESLCARNASVEISTASDDDTLALVYRVRLISFGTEGLAVQCPDRFPSHRDYKPGTIVSMLAIDGEWRWSIITHVIGLAKHKLNDQLIIPVIKLAPPIRVDHSQQRNHYRVCTDKTDLPPIQLIPDLPTTNHTNISPDDHDPTPPITATVLNISCGGIGIELNLETALSAGRIVQYLCLLTLPNEPKPMTLPVRLVYVKPHPDDNTCYWGLKFTSDDQRAPKNFEDPIGYFITNLQRKQLQARSRQHK